MGNIHVLDFHVANLIAAGEVVDRPASVIKELMENALDAGSTSVTVEIKRGGVAFMRVSDNGCGMKKEDVPVCIQRHATSKIRDERDLDGILTLGFRGEALAAIAAVSHLRILTRQKDAETGTVLECDSGRVIDLSDTGCSVGTTVIVEELFARVPARRKFLKKDVTETAACAAVVEKIALSRPDVAVRLITDGAVKFHTAGDGKLINAIYAVLGREFAGKLIEVHTLSEGIEISGFVGTPDNARGNRNFENFFINGRYVKSKTAMAALEQAFDSYLPGERFPCCVLNLILHPAFVDVNVHPAKLEVKFSNERLVFDSLYSAVRNVLAASLRREALSLKDTDDEAAARRMANAFAPLADRGTAAPERDALFNRTPLPPYSSPTHAAAGRTGAGTSSSPSHTASPPAPTTLTPADSLRVLEAMRAGTVGDGPVTESFPIPEPTPPVTPTAAPTAAPAAAEGTASASPDEEENTSPLPFYKILGSAFNAYVLVELDDTVLLIDKHAAHERINFETMKRNRQKGGYGQLLMIPVSVTLTADETAALDRYDGEIRGTGFDFEVKDDAVYLFQIPAELEPGDAAAVFQTMTGALADGTGSAGLTRDILFEKALYQAACKASVKAGRTDADENIDWIVRRVLTDPAIRYCPHGRPVAFELSRHDIEKQFKRT